MTVRLAVVSMALLVAANAHGQTLRLPKFAACEVDVAAINAPIGLVRFTAPDPAIAFATSTEAGLSLGRKPALAARITRQGPGAAWHLWLMRDVYSPGKYVPPDAVLRFRAKGYEDRQFAQRIKGDWQVFDISIDALLAAYPELSKIAYSLHGNAGGLGARGRTFASNTLDLDRLRSLVAWADRIDRDARAGQLPCGVPTTQLPAAVDPTAHVDCRLGEAGGYLGWDNVWGDLARVAWQYHLARPPEPNAYINLELAGPVAQIETTIPNPPPGAPDPMDFHLWVILFPDSHALVTQGGLKSEDQPRLSVRFEGDWGHREMSLREANSRWPVDLVAKVMASHAELNLTVLGPNEQHLQTMTLPAGTLANGRAIIRRTLEELSRRVSDPMTYCAPEMSIVVT